MQRPFGNELPERVGGHGTRQRASGRLLALLTAGALANGCGGNDSPIEPPPDPPRPTTVTVSPATAELSALDATVQLTAQVRDQHGRTMAGATVAWSSSAAAVATVDGSGLVTAVGNGTATVTASASAALGAAAVTVAQSPDSVAVIPAEATFAALDDTLRLAAEAFDANGRLFAGASITWESSDAAVAAVDGSGLVTAMGNGTATVTASARTASGTARMTTSQQAASISVTPSIYRLVRGGTVRAAAIALDANGHRLSDPAISWTSSDSAVAAVDASGRIRAIDLGTAIVIAASGDVEGTSQIAVVAPPAVRRVDIASRPTNGGVHDGAGAWEVPVDEVFTRELVATPNSGYDFDHWAEGGVPISFDSAFRMEVAGVHELSAHFTVNPERGKWGPGNTFTDWAFPDSTYERVAWTFIPVLDPPESLRRKGLLHYYAVRFFLQNSTPQLGGGYAGLLTDGHFRREPVGKAINFAIWGSNAANSAHGLIDPANDECRCHQIMLPYEFRTGRSYRFEVRPGPSGVEDQGKWWGLWVTDVMADKVTFVGETRVPTVFNGRPTTMLKPVVSAIGEDLHWWRSRDGTKGYICSDFEASSFAIVDLAAGDEEDRPWHTSPWTSSAKTETAESGYTTTLCHVTVFATEAGDVQHNVGFWPEPPSNVLSRDPM